MADSQQPQTPGRLVGARVSRRGVVRTAAHAAWVVPLVQVASMAPALAASGKSLTVTAAIASWSGSGTAQTFTLSVTVTNTGSVTATVSSVSLIFPSGWNPNCGTVSGWTRSGNNSATVTYSRGTAISLAAGASTSFTVTVNPVNSYVGAGTYVADGGGLSVTAASTTSGVVVTPAVIDIPGLYQNLVMTGTATWTRTSGLYYLTATATLTNRGRTATTDLDVVGTVEGCGTSTGDAINVGSGWTYRTSPDVHYERTGAELAAGGSISFTATRQMTGSDAGTSGTLTLTPRDNGTTNENVTAATIAVPNYGAAAAARSARPTRGNGSF